MCGIENGLLHSYISVVVSVGKNFNPSLLLLAYEKNQNVSSRKIYIISYAQHLCGVYIRKGCIIKEDGPELAAMKIPVNFNTGE